MYAQDFHDDSVGVGLVEPILALLQNALGAPELQTIAALYAH
jgi:hypothetical protein